MHSKLGLSSVKGYVITKFSYSNFCQKIKFFNMLNFTLQSHLKAVINHLPYFLFKENDMAGIFLGLNNINYIIITV